MTRNLRFSSGYFAMAVLTFLTEVVIAVAVHDEFVRPFVGDMLVVVLIFATLLSFWNAPRIPTALAVFAFDCAIEVAQYFASCGSSGSKARPGRA